MTKTTGRHPIVTRAFALLLATVACAGVSPAAGQGPADATEASWVQRVTASVTTAEYYVTWQPRTRLAGVEAAWHAPNRAHGLRTYFTESGPRVIPREEEQPSWEWGLALVGYGRGGQVRPVTAPSLRPEENRIVYEREVVKEWYENSSRGLKQGFMLSVGPEEIEGDLASGAAPQGPRAAQVDTPRRAELVHLDLRLVGTLEPAISADGQAVDFRTGRGVNAIHYAELVVTDARGRTLPAWIEGFSGDGFGGLRIVFDDEGATYPVDVDPLATTTAWTAEGDQADSSFGFSVATAGDVNGDGFSDVIVGAYLYDNGETDEGRAFVYHGSASGPATTATWTAEGDQADATFGYSVATAGDVNGDGYSDVIVGAYLYDNGETDEGGAFVFHGSASGLAPTVAWTAGSDQADAWFGLPVAPAGDVNGDGYADVIIGAHLYDNGEANEGRAFVYHGSASGLAPTAAWTTEGDQASAFFGFSVSTAGDVDADGYADVIVGAQAYDNGQSNEGRAFVYHGSASGLAMTAGWVTEGGQEGGRFGVSVATAGDVNGDGYADVIVGAQEYDTGETDEGRAFVYHGSASGLAPTANWWAESNQSGAWFGFSVAPAGDVNGDDYADVIVGAFLYDNGETDEGRAFVYYGSASGLAATAAWTAESDQAGASLGYSVAPAGDVNGDGYADVIVGAYLYDNGETDEGRAFLYQGSAVGLAATAGWTAESNQMNAWLGYSVATAGDVNGDGYADVIAGALAYDNAGRAFVFHGSASGLATTAAWTAGSNQAGAGFGGSVATAGDVNGDGYADVIVGAAAYDNGETNEGRAFVYHGSTTGLATTAAWTAEGNLTASFFGGSVATAGDFNGDGYADVIVGAKWYSNPEAESGRAFVYYGSASGLNSTAAWTAENDQAGGFGDSVATAGDVNGDGYADVIVGAFGRAFVYHGSASGPPAAAAWTVADGSSSFGESAASAGDVNGDGYADVIVGERYYSDGEFQEGRAVVYHGSASGLATTVAWTAGSNQAGAEFGGSVASAGDVNGDGYADVIVGAYDQHNGETGEGRAFVYHGSASGLATTFAWTAEGDQAGARFGYSVATAGDVDGDGYADVIVGADEYGNEMFEMEEGRVFAYYGNGGTALSQHPEQRRVDDSAPIAPQGSSDATDSFRLSALGRTPYGRSLVRLEWEVKPLGSLFDGTGTETSADWVDSGISGAGLEGLVAGLFPGDVYHWRLRPRYHPSTTPFLPHGRWLTVPHNGWQEGDLRLRRVSDLAIDQVDLADPILLSELTYVISVTNAGPDSGTASVYDTLPAGAVFISSVPSQGVCFVPTGGMLRCDLGLVTAGGGATVSVIVVPGSPGAHVNSATVGLTFPGNDVEFDLANNASSETTTVLEATPGDRVWEDTDGDGIQDPGEPGVLDVLVVLYDGAGQPLDFTVTDASGAYGFSSQPFGAAYRVRFVPPSGYVLTSQDQGADDAIDSDADPLTQFTPLFDLVSVEDPFRWDAGLIPSCLPPDEPIYLYTLGLTPDGNAYPILHFQDPNQPSQITGYNVYRSSDPSPPPASWPLLGSDVIDMDEATPNKQWVDTTGDDSPSGTWYYHVTAFNSRCPAEGPF